MNHEKSKIPIEPADLHENDVIKFRYLYPKTGTPTRYGVFLEIKNELMYVEHPLNAEGERLRAYKLKGVRDLCRLYVEGDHTPKEILQRFVRGRG